MIRVVDVGMANRSRGKRALPLHVDRIMCVHHCVCTQQCEEGEEGREGDKPKNAVNRQDTRRVRITILSHSRGRQLLRLWCRPGNNTDSERETHTHMTSITATEAYKSNTTHPAASTRACSATLNTKLKT